MSGQLYVETFGKLDRLLGDTPINLDDGAEDLLGVFDGLGEMMGWSGHNDTDRPFLWELYEAEFTAGDGDDVIGFANVGVGFGPPVPSEPTPPPPPGGKHYANFGWHRRSLDPSLVLPALIQCFYNALRRFGAIELTGVQVYGTGFDPRIERFRSVPNWFNIGPAEKTQAIVTFDEGLLGGPVEPQAIADHFTVNAGQFRIGPLVDLSEEYSIGRKRAEWPFMMSVSPYEKGLAVSLPEWTPTAIGYALGMVTEQATRIDPTPKNFVVGITRLPQDPSS